MGIALFLIGIGAACLLIWRALIYAVPVYLGFAAGFWSLKHGEGVLAVLVGVGFGASALGVGGRASRSGKPVLRFSTLMLFAVPAGFAGFGAANAFAALLAPSP